MTIDHSTPNNSNTDGQQVLDRTALMNAGLCANCDQRHHCATLDRATRPIMFCEEHCCDHGSNVHSFREGLHQETVTSEEPGNVHLMGLCVNCENRTTCRLAKSNGGVWHCEEYR